MAQQSTQDTLKKLTELYQRGATLVDQKRFAEAAPFFDELLRYAPQQPGPYVYAASCYGELQQFRKALEAIEKAIEFEKNDSGLYGRKIDFLYNLGEIEKALETGQYLVENFPDEHDAVVVYAALCAQCGHDYYQGGIEAIEKVLAIDPNNVEALNTMGVFFSNSGKYLDASNYFIRALRIKPDHKAALINLSGCFDKTGAYEMAIKFYDSLLQIYPDNGLAKAAKATVLSNLGQSAENMPLLEAGLKWLREDGDKTNYVIYASNYVFYIHYVPHVARQKIKNAIDEWYKTVCGHLEEKPRLEFANNPDPARKLRVGLFSNSFRKHPVTWMTLAAIENLDRNMVEIWAYSDVMSSKKDDVTDRYYKLCDKVTETKGISNPELVKRMRADNIDILLELTGHSEGGSRLSIAAERVAPVQVKWVGGLFDTTGLPEMDWIIGDNIETPEGDEVWYSEKIYRMPDDYVVYEPPAYVGEVGPLPALDNGYVTFGNFNNTCKTNTYSIALWSKILKAVPRSRLLMKEVKMKEADARKYVEEAFAKNGIGIDRLILESGEPHKFFVESYNRVDIALDPHPYTGGLSTCEALWMGVPVVTLPGETFAGRHAATHLHNAGYPDWIAKDENDYVNIAVKWANDLSALADLRANMREQVRNSALCDGPRFARNFEKALRFMWEDWCNEKNGVNIANETPKAITPPRRKKKSKKKKG